MKEQPAGAGADPEAAGLLRGSAPGASFEQEVMLIDPDEQLQRGRSTPLWTWLLLVAAVHAVSSAGVVFALMKEVPPITLAAWRLQLTSVFLGLAAAVQFWRMPSADRRRTLQQGGLLAASGTCLAFHFGCWVYSVENTSLTHSLLFVSASPSFIAAGTWLLGRPISGGELGGTAVGVAGGVVLATAAARSDEQVTIKGDMAALAASLCIVGYLLIGQKLRAWMPAFVYAFCVTVLAALELTLAALVFEGAGVLSPGLHGVFGWAASAHYLPYVLYLAVGPGIVGHTGFNTLLRYMQPLIISLACNLEPLIGSVLGWAAGVVSAPGPWTYVGGALVMASTAAVSLASHRREKQQASKEQAAREVQRILGGGGGGGGGGSKSVRGLNFYDEDGADELELVVAGERSADVQQGSFGWQEPGWQQPQQRAWQQQQETVQQRSDSAAAAPGSNDWGGLWGQLAGEDQQAAAGRHQHRLRPGGGKAAGGDG